MDERNEEEKLGLGESLEKKILKSLIVDRKFLVSVVDLLRPAYFTTDMSYDIFKIIRDFFLEYQDVITTPVLVKELKEKIADKKDAVKTLYLNYIKDVYKQELTPAVKEYLKSECILFCKRQAYKNALIDSSTLIDTDGFEKINSIFKKVSLIGTNEENEIDYFLNVKERILSELVEVDYVPTGVAGLDKILRGGWNYKTHPLSIFMAPSNVGKSIALCYTGANAVKNNRTVFHYTFELSTILTASRYDAAITSLEIDKRHEKIDEVEKRLKLLQDTNANSKLFIKEYSTGTCTPTMLRADIEKKISQGFNPDLVIIDYLDIMRLDGFKADDTYLSQQKLSEELRAIGQDYRVPVITATQTNREGVSAKEEIESDKVSDSYGKIKTADLVISINQTKQEHMQNKARFYIAKNRAGKVKKIIPVIIKYDTMTISDASNAEIINEILRK